MNIRVDLNYPIKNGTEVVFRSPVDCSKVTGLSVYYPEDGVTASKEFVFADAHGNNVGDIDHLFAENVAVKVILDASTGMAFVQNADTNAYLEERFAKIENQIAVGWTFDHTKYGLPVLDLTGDVSAMTKDNAVPLNYAYGERSGSCSVKWQGSSSLAYPKKNYTVKFDKAFEAADGWGEQKKYCLKANYIDHSHARNIVSCKLWGQMAKERTVTSDSFDMDNVTGCISPGLGNSLSQYMTIEDGVITMTATSGANGHIYYTGNTLVKGSYIVCWDAKPLVTTESEDRAFRIVAGVIGNQTHETKMWTDYADKKLDDGWVYFKKEVEITEDGSMIGLLGHRQPFQFRNIRVIPNILRNSFDIGWVTGCVDIGSGANKTQYMAIGEDAITIGTSGNSEWVYFTGNKFYAGKYTLYIEAKPLVIESNDDYAFRFFVGTIGNTTTQERWWANSPTGTLEDGWVYFTKEIEITEDGGMFGFGGHGNPLQFRNIRMTNNNGSTEGDDGYPTYGIKELFKLPNGGAIDGFPCVVTINGEYMGLYTFNIPKDGWMFGMGESETEAIVCANTHSAATRFEAEATLTSADFEVEYAKDEDNTEWIRTSLNRLINAVKNSDGTDLDTTVAKYLDWQSAIDYYIYTVLLKGGDMTDKNYLLATYDGVKWFFSAYDCDSTYGLYWDGKGFDPAKGNPDFTGNWNKVMTLIRTYKKDELKARYAELRDGAMSDDNFTHAFTSFVCKIPDRIYMSDTEVWPMIPSSSASNLAQIVNWYRMRAAIIDAEIEAL